MVSAKACLFGGTLLAAGMTAQGQSLLIQNTDTTGTYGSFAQSLAYGTALPFGDYVYAPAALNTYNSAYNAYTGTSSFATAQTSTRMASYALWDGGGILGYGYGFSFFSVFFQVDMAATVTISWDVSGTDGYANGAVLTDPAGNTILDFDPLVDGLTGSVSSTLAAGVDYRYVGGMRDVLNTGAGPFITTPNVLQFVELEISEIPAPGATGLLALAGLAAARRRRA